MPRYKIEIEYAGTGFCGWQIQNTGLSVQEAIEKAIFKFSQEKVTVTAAGRTDAGVHAIGQVAHFDLVKHFSPYTITNAINFYLKPNLIGIQSCELVSDDFHARFSAKRRHYLYRIINRTGKNIIELDRVWWVKQPLCIEDMRAAAQYLVGMHDFTSFRALNCQAKSPIKSIEKIEIFNKNCEININISAPSFLYHMVRNITGALVEVGLKKIAPQKMQEILAVKDRAKAPATAPACGLYFKHVEY